MSNWNTSNYQRRKAQREAVTAQWVQNPETEEWFFLKRIGGLATMIAGMMPDSLSTYAVGQWEQQGMDVGGSESPARSDEVLSEDDLRNLRLMSSVVSRSCVIPVLIPTNAARPTKFSDEWTEMVCQALAAQYKDFDREQFTPESIMLDAEDLDDSDLQFIVAYASGRSGQTALKGGQAMNVADIKSVPPKLNRGPGTSAAKQKLRTGT